MNPPTTSIGYSKWDISLSKWDMPIIACNATMTALLRCVPLLWDCDTPYSQITSCSGIAAIMDTVCATLSKPISMRIPRTKLRMPASCYHNVIKRRGALFHWRDGQFGHARPPAVLHVCTAFAASPPLAHGTTRSQRGDRQNVTMSSACH